MQNWKWLFTLFPLLLTACGDMVSVPPAATAIVKDKAGYVGDFIPPSAFRLPVCFIEPCPTAVYIDMQDKRLTESMDVFLPKSNMQINDVEVNITLGLSTDDAMLKKVLAKVTPHTGKDGRQWITFKQVYNTYAKERVRAIVREAVSSKKLEWLVSNREVYGNEVHKLLITSMKRYQSPFIVRQLSFAKLNPPEVIRRAFEKAKEREVELAQVEAEKQKAIMQAEAALEVSKRQAAVQLEKAKAFKAEAEAMAEAATPQWLAMRRLQVLEGMAANGSAVFIPMNMSPAEASIIRGMGIKR